jgi:transposase
MAIVRRCRGRCANSRRCLEHLGFDGMYRGARYRMVANDFAVPRMDRGKQRPIQSMEEARHWERLFIGEIQAGRDPRRPRTKRAAHDIAPTNVSAFLDAYMDRCVRPAGLRSIRSVQSRVAALKQYLGELPLDALEKNPTISIGSRLNRTTRRRSRSRPCIGRWKRCARR